MTFEETKEFKEWLKELTAEDKAWIFKEYGKYDYYKAYINKDKS